MKREQCRAGARSLMSKAKRHETCAETLAATAQMFVQHGNRHAATQTVRACHLHRVWALQAKAQAQALLMSGQGSPDL